jgi:hypothetical protein
LALLLIARCYLFLVAHVAICSRRYLEIASKWEFFGANLYEAEMVLRKEVTEPAFLAVQEHRVCVLNATTFDTLHEVGFKVEAFLLMTMHAASLLPAGSFLAA